MKYIAPFIVIFVVIGLLVIIFSENFTPADSTEFDPATTTQSTTDIAPPANWVMTRGTSDTGLRFNFSRPPAATFEQVQPNVYELTYVGPNSEPQTEITDGFTVRLVFATGTPAGYIAQSVTTPVETDAVTVADFPAERYQTESALGTNVTHTVLALGNNQILDIGVTTAGAAAASYQDTVTRVINSVSVETNIDAGENDTAGAVIPDMIRVSEPAEGVAISSPVSISGEARGTWFFEADAPVVVTDWDGRIIGEGFVTTDGDWMTESFVPFSGSVSFTIPSDGVSDRGAVILQKANPSGLPANDAALEITVTLQ